MKKLVFLLALYFIFAGTESALAEEQMPMHSWDIGTHISHIKYKEPGVMKEEGYMYGFNGSYTYRDDFMLKAEGRFSFGQVDYTSPWSGTLDNLDDYIVELRGLVGHDFISKTSTYTPYIGLGYRYLYDDLRGITSSGARGYRRKSNYFYTPIGIEALTTVNGSWSIAAVLEYDYFLFGVQHSLLSDAGLGEGDISNVQNYGTGFRGSIKIQIEDAEIDYTIEPYFIYWDIDDSELELIPGGGGSYGYEPANNSTEYGIRVSASF